MKKKTIFREKAAGTLRGADGKDNDNDNGDEQQSGRSKHVARDEDGDGNKEGEEEQEEPEENVFQLAMDEKANAMHRGKSAEYDRVMALPEPLPETPDSSSRQRLRGSTSGLSVPGAFRIKRGRENSIRSNNDNDDEDDDEDRTITSPIESDVIYIPKASLVVEDDPELQLTSLEDVDLEAASVLPLPPIVRAVEKVHDESGDTAMPMATIDTKRRQFFRLLILMVLITIAAALIAILIQLDLGGDDDDVSIEITRNLPPPQFDKDKYYRPPPNPDTIDYITNYQADSTSIINNNQTIVDDAGGLN